MGNPDGSFTSPKPVEPTTPPTENAGMSADEAKALIDSKPPLISLGSDFQFKERKDVPATPTPSTPTPPTPVDTAPIPAIEAVVPGTTQTAVIHTLEAAGLVALSFILTTLVGSVGHFDVSHWQPIYQALWTYALPTIVLGIQSALKMVEAKKETVLAQKTLNAAKSMMKSFNAKSVTA